MDGSVKNLLQGGVHIRVVIWITWRHRVRFFVLVIVVIM